ncbi:hypothetical protein Tco_1059057 [Tanacetum coccineum]
MYKEFNAFNKLESLRLDNLQEQGIKTNLDKSIRLEVQKGMKEVRDKLSFCTSTVDINSQHIQDLKLMFKDMFSLLEAAEVFKKANAEGKKWEKNNPESPAEEKDDAPHPDKSKGDKKPKFIILTSSAIPSPIPLKSIMPKLLQKPDANKMIMDQFTEHLTNTISSIFSHSPPKEPTPPRYE